MGSLIRFSFEPVWPDGSRGCAAGAQFQVGGHRDDNNNGGSGGGGDGNGDARASDDNGGGGGDDNDDDDDDDDDDEVGEEYVQPHSFEAEGIVRAYSVATGQHLVQWTGCVRVCARAGALVCHIEAMHWRIYAASLLRSVAACCAFSRDKDD